MRAGGRKSQPGATKGGRAKIFVGSLFEEAALMIAGNVGKEPPRPGSVCIGMIQLQLGACWRGKARRGARLLCW